MKTGKIILLLCLIILGCPAFGSVPNEEQPEQDTIIVTFGKKGKMVIYVDNKEDFKVLKAYDLNTLLSKIDLYLDSTYQEEDYLNDTSFTFHTPVSVNGKSGEQEVVVKVETLEQKLDSLEGDLENAAENIEQAAENVEKVTVRLGSLHIDIDPKEETEEKVKVYRKHEETKKVRYYFNLHLGLNNYFEKDHFPSNESTPYSLSPLRSRYFAIDFLQKVKIAGPLYLTSGLELAFNNYTFRDEKTIAKSNGVLVFEDLERDPIKSKLSTTYLNVPVMALFDFEGKYKIGFGAYAGYRLGSHTKIKYASGDNRKEKDRSDFYLNDWRYGVRGMIGVKSVKFFVNYDLNPLFKENRLLKNNTPVKLNSFSFGIII